jgi:hypothetical protein
MMGQPKKQAREKLTAKCVTYMRPEDFAALDSFAKEHHWSRAAVIRHLIYMLREGKRTLIVVRPEPKRKKGGGREKSAADQG